MSGVGVTAGVPVASAASEPKWVREGSPQTRQAYAGALVFEQMLVGELTQTMAAAGGLGGEGAEGEAEPGSGEGGAAATASPGGFGALSAQALADAITRDGGLGMAAQLTRAQTAGSEGTHDSAALAGGTPA